MIPAELLPYVTGEGKIRPLFTQQPNLYYDVFLFLLTSDDYKVLAALTRKIFGWHKEGQGDRVSISQIVAVTDLGENTVGASLRRLVGYGVVVKLEEAKGKAAATFDLQLDATRIDFATLRRDRDHRARTRQGKVRAAVEARAKAEDVPEVDQDPPDSATSHVAQDTPPCATWDVAQDISATSHVAGGSENAPRPTWTQNKETPREINKDSATDVATGVNSPSEDTQPEPKAESVEAQRRRVLAVLEPDFAQVSGLFLPARKTERQKGELAVLWWGPLWTMFQVAGRDVESTKRGYRLAIDKMTREGLTIASPKSVVATFQAMAAEARRKKQAARADAPGVNLTRQRGA